MSDLNELTCKIEALLFSSGRKMTVEELTHLCRATAHQVKEVLTLLQNKYQQETTSLFLIEEQNSWRLVVKEKFLSLVRSIVAETELSKSILETLAVVAWRSPVLQADVISIRTNKAYDHLRELEDAGFISRTRKGRTQLLKLTEKFFKYFELDKAALKHHIGNTKEASSIADKLELRQRDTKLDDFDVEQQDTDGEQQTPEDKQVD